MKRLPKRGAFFYGFFSLFGKAPVCGTGEQGSIPGDTQNIKSHGSNGYSIDLIRRRLKVRFLLGLQKCDL
ncbi:protein of unknown function [Chryseobacterium sp. JV274]|nr:protein of unknown function [Chryseobacterium sp. JV274]